MYVGLLLRLSDPLFGLFVIRLIRKTKTRKKKEREKWHARIELAGYQARVQQFTSENPVIPRDGAPLMPLGCSIFYSNYIPNFFFLSFFWAVLFCLWTFL